MIGKDSVCKDLYTQYSALIFHRFFPRPCIVNYALCCVLGLKELSVNLIKLPVPFLFFDRFFSCSVVVFNED